MNSLIDHITEDLNIPYNSFLQLSTKVFLEKQLKEIQTQIYEIAVKYKVKSIFEFEKKYKTGTLDEFETFPDYKELDRLEYKKERIQKMLNSLGKIS